MAPAEPPGASKATAVENGPITPIEPPWKKEVARGSTMPSWRISTLTLPSKAVLWPDERHGRRDRRERGRRRQLQVRCRRSEHPPGVVGRQLSERAPSSRDRRRAAGPRPRRTTASPGTNEPTTGSTKPRYSTANDSAASVGSSNRTGWEATGHTAVAGCSVVVWDATGSTAGSGERHHHHRAGPPRPASHVAGFASWRQCAPPGPSPIRPSVRSAAVPLSPCGEGARRGGAGRAADGC